MRTRAANLEPKSKVNKLGLDLCKLLQFRILEMKTRAFS